MNEDRHLLSVRIEKSTLRKLTIAAKKENRKLAAMIRIALLEWVDRKAKENAA